MKQVLQTGHLVRILAIVVAGVLLVACGSDEGDKSPTSTTAAVNAQPTVETEATSDLMLASSPSASAPSVPTNTDMSTADMRESPAAVATPADMAASGTAVSAGGTPELEPASSTPAASPVAAQETMPAAPPVGDGTTGALTAGTPVASPSSSPVASPVSAQASPMASPAARGTPGAPVTVQGCDVPNVPPFTGGPTRYQLTTDLNFRTGPGTDCAPALDQPIGEFQVVEVIGGPVVREGDTTEWVQIRVLDTEGWVAFEFLEPVQP